VFLVLPYAEQFMEVWLSVLKGTEFHSLSYVTNQEVFVNVPGVS